MDLNYLIHIARERGLDEGEYELMVTLVKKYEVSPTGPMCCHSIGKLEDLTKRLSNNWWVRDREIDLNNFRNYSEKSDDLVIFCSRGCMSYGKHKAYSEKLCKECVSEAKEILSKISLRDY